MVVLLETVFLPQKLVALEAMGVDVILIHTIKEEVHIHESFYSTSGGELSYANTLRVLLLLLLSHQR